MKESKHIRFFSHVKFFGFSLQASFCGEILKNEKLGACLQGGRVTLFLLYKNIFYKNIEAQICKF